MAYYLGRDIDIALTTEHSEYSIGLATSYTSEEEAIALDHKQSSDANSVGFVSATHKTTLFAGPRNTGADTDASHNPWAGSMTGDATPLLNEAWTNVPKNITGLDLSFGVQDEDIAFVGQRSVLKAEIKKDNSVTLTRKKNDNVWGVIYNDARFGLAEEPATGGYHGKTDDPVSPFHIGLDAPDYVECGYRVYLRFGGSTTADEIFVLKNAYVTDYSVTLGADSSQEESITLQSYIDPIITDGVATDALDTVTDASER